MKDKLGFGGGPTYVILWSIDLFVTRDLVILLSDMHAIIS